MNKLLTLNTIIPNGYPADPVLVFHDNGSWEIAFAGDVDYIRNYGEPAMAGTDITYVGHAPVVDIIDKYLALLGKPALSRYADADISTAHLFLSVSAPYNCPEEPVVAVYFDGTVRVMTEWMASRDLDEDENLLNYIPLAALIEDIRTFVSTNVEAMRAKVKVVMDAKTEAAA